MRLWSIHPSYLDAKGLVALWREGLLARAVLRGRTKGYRSHPQLERFRQRPAPVSAINQYLGAVLDEATSRGYTFDGTRIGPVRKRQIIAVTRAQLEFEIDHLRRKLEQRAPHRLGTLSGAARQVIPHPMFVLRDGPVESWERGSS